MNVDLKKLIKEIVIQWKFIFQLSFFLFVSSLVYVFFFYQHEYTSSSKVYLSDKSSNQLSLGGLSQFGLQMPFSQGSATGKLSIVSELVGSFSFLEKILNDDVRISENEFTSLYNYLNQDGPDSSHQLTVDLVNKLTTKISVTENYQSFIVKIKVTDENKYFAQSLNELIILKLNTILSEMNKQVAYEKLTFINQRISEVNKDLNEAEDALKDFKYKNKQINSSVTLQLESERLIRNLAFQTSIMSTLLGQREVAKIQNIDDAKLFNVLDSPNLPFYASTIRKLYLLVLYSMISLLIPIFIITLRLFSKNFFIRLSNTLNSDISQN
ncbi:MAG: hypothetical protein CMD72_03850 [Gammaproteobacteria bacterium]|nr:hypothetical protein [Gammaproteobacteria bacterium]